MLRLRNVKQVAQLLESHPQITNLQMRHKSKAGVVRKIDMMKEVEKDIMEGDGEVPKIKKWIPHKKIIF